VAVHFSAPKYSIAFLDLFRVLDVLADGEKFLFHCANNSDFHATAFFDSDYNIRDFGGNF
jgi:hypothetical protein